MKKTNKLFAILLAIFMMAIIAPMAFAADEVVTIDLANGNVTITETGYSIDGGAETAFTGDYVITGKNDTSKSGYVIVFESIAEGTDITFKDVEITKTDYSGIWFKCDTDIYVTGKMILVGKYSPMFTGIAVNITGDADIEYSGGFFNSTKISIQCNSLSLEKTLNGQMIATSKFHVEATEDICFAGNISCGEFKIVAGNNITYGSDSISAAEVNMTAGNDISLISGNGGLSGGEVNITAGNDITSTININTLNVKMVAGNNIIQEGGGAPIEQTPLDFGNKLVIKNAGIEHTHTFADVAYNNDATCKADGTKLVKCDCDWAKEKTVTAEGTKLDHTFTKYEVVTAPTCEATGLEKAYCDYGCGATDDNELPVLGHADEDGDNICDNGGESMLCKDCGRPVHGDTLVDNFVCWLVMLFNLIKSMF